MSRFYSKPSCIVWLIFVISINNFVASGTTVSEAIEKANKLKNLSKQYDEKIVSLEIKIEDLEVEIENLKKTLEDAATDGSMSPVSIKMTENKLKRAAKKLLKLTNKLEKLEQKADTISDDAEQAVNVAKRLASQKKFNSIKSKLQEKEQLLAFYKDKVIELEVLEREARAEVIAQTKIVAMSKSSWDRWRSDWKKGMIESKANGYLSDLRSY